MKKIKVWSYKPEDESGWCMFKSKREMLKCLSEDIDGFHGVFHIKLEEMTAVDFENIPDFDGW